MPNQPTSARNYWIPALVLGLTVVGVAVWAAFRWSETGPWVAPAEVKGIANPVPANTTNLASGKLIYEDRCARCHGDQGNGDGPDASMYRTPPGVLSDSRVIGAETDAEIFWKIKTGRRPMPAFGNELSDQQCWQLVDLIRSFAHASPANAAPSPNGLGSSGKQ